MKLLTVRDLAEVLRVSVRTAYVLVREPGFPAAKVRGQYRISETALERWVETRSSTHSADRRPK